MEQNSYVTTPGPLAWAGNEKYKKSTISWSLDHLCNIDVRNESDFARYFADSLLNKWVKIQFILIFCRPIPLSDNCATMIIDSQKFSIPKLQRLFM